MPVPAVEGLTAFEEIGRGGFGVVYRAHQEALGRDVAVKVLPGVQRDSQAFARFERECRAIGSVGAHPNIATVYGCGVTTDGEGYLALELLEGGDLAERIAAGPLPWQEAARIGVALSGALESAHRLGVLHRDIKPQNVLFDRLGTPKLLDFGIASVPGSYQTRTSSGSMTLAHAAPEIIAGGRATVASDVYALASTLWAAIAGAAPFVRDGEDTLVPLLARIAAAPVPPLDAAPPVLSALLAKALAKDPAERPASAEELGTGLAYVLRSSGETVDGPAVLTPSVRAAGTASAVEAGALVSDASEQTRSRDAVVPVAGLAAAAESEAEEEDPDRRRRRAAFLVAAVIFLLYGGLALAGVFNNSGGGAAAAASDSSSAAASTARSGGSSSAGHPTSSPTHSSARPSAHSSGTPDRSSATTSELQQTGAESSSTGGVTTQGQGTSTVGHSSATTSSPASSVPSSSAASSTPTPTPTPSTSTSSPPPPPPGAPVAGAAKLLRRTASAVRVELVWQPPATGGTVTSYDVRRTLMHGQVPQGGPLIVVKAGTSRDDRVDVPLVSDTQGWFRWQVRSRGPGGLSSWHLLRVRLTDLTGHGCSPSVVGMRATGLQTTSRRLAGGTGTTFHVTKQSIAPGVRRPGRALLLTCARP